MVLSLPIPVFLTNSADNSSNFFQVEVKSVAALAVLDIASVAESQTVLVLAAKFVVDALDVCNIYNYLIINR
jgi:hypothetical protein